MTAWGILVGAGIGKRFGGTIRKPYVKVAGKPLAWYSLSTLLNHSGIRGVVWVVHPSDWKSAEGVARSFHGKSLLIVTGGARRQDSVKMGLMMLPKSVEWVAVHDAARPLLTPALLTAVLKGARKTGAAILALPVAQTAKREDGRGRILKTVPRDGLWMAHTPQVFRRSLLVQGFERAQGRDVTDDAMLVEGLKKPVALIPSSPWNIKVTTPEDLSVVEALLKLRWKK